MPDGASANKSGRIFEEQLEPVFRGRGYKIVTWGSYHRAKRKGETVMPMEPKRKYAKCERIVIKNYPFTTIYGSLGHTEYLIIQRKEGRERRVRVEAKWQQCSGSVDEKLPYTWLSAAQAYEESEIVLVIDGEGFRSGAREWIVQKAEEKWLVEPATKVVMVKTISEFTAWFSRELG